MLISLHVQLMWEMGRPGTWNLVPLRLRTFWIVLTECMVFGWDKGRKRSVESLRAVVFRTRGDSWIDGLSAIA
jgi:hypothetical protein